MPDLNKPTLHVDSPPQATVAARQAQSPQTHQQLVGVARQMPQNVDTWLRRADTAPTREERLLCLSAVLQFDPGHQVARQALQATLRDELEEDPFLAYGSEDERLYYIRTAANVPVTVAKERAIAEIYPPPTLSPMSLAERWLALAILGLVPAGLGALICAPVVAIYAWQRGRQLPEAERRWRVILFIAATMIWLLGGLLTWLFILHL